jgi:hypothetical protein
VRRLLRVVFFFEIGLVLVVMPWLGFWDRNYFGQLVPLLGSFMANNFVRGAVSGLGVINIVAGCVELVSILLTRSADRHASITST